MATQATRYPEVGDKASDFTLTDLDGAPVSLSDYRGKKVFLHSWGSY